MTLLSIISKRLAPLLPAFYQAAIGTALGTVLLCAFSRIRHMLGTDNVVTVAILVSACVSLLIANFSVSRNWIKKPLSSAFCLAGFWVILQPSLLLNLFTGFQHLTLDIVGIPYASLSLSIFTCLVALGPIFFACHVAMFTTLESRTSTIQVPVLFGFVLSWFLGPLMLIPWFGSSFTIMLAMGIGALSIFAMHNKKSLEQKTEQEEVPAGFDRSTTLLLDSLLCLCSGAGFILATHTVGLIFTSSTLYESLLWAGLGFGIVISLMTQRLLKSSTRTPVFSGLVLGCWCGLMVIGFPILTNTALSISTWVSSTWLIFACRALVVTLVTAPIGFCFGDVISRNGFRNESRTCVASTALFACGFAIPLFCNLTIPTLTLSICIISLTIPFIAWSGDNFALPKRFALPACGLIAATFAVLGCFMPNRYTSQLSERVLFSGQAFSSHRNGVDTDSLPWLDDSRLTAEFETVNGRWSIWKHRSSQLVIKHNGLSTDYISSASDVCPQVISEVCPVLFPLVLHPAADNVLVIGLHSSTLKTCAEFPLQSVTTLESDTGASAVIELLKQQNVIPDDSTQHFMFCNQQLALAAQHAEKYDVIVCPSPQVLEAGSAARLLPAYYRSIARHLSNDGIFSQRVPYYDLGPETIQTITKSLQSVFPQVLMTEPVAGELVFLATNIELPLVTEGVVDRLQYPQARRVLSQIGWDWSVPLSRGALSSESLKQLSKQTQCPKLHEYDLAFKLPIEVSRWGNKSTKTRVSLSKHGKTLGTFLGDIAVAKDVSERLEDLRLAQKVLTEHPDQFWAYRSVLKQQLKDRPRAKVMTVKHEGVKRALHPEDQRRKDYLVALGNAATQEHPSRADIEFVSQFATNEDFDPLVNYFVHHEVALLCERAAEPVPNLELYHRLHAIYFAPPQEKSVRDVCRSISLITVNHELNINDEQRWDHLNGLLEVMKQRWSVRINDTKHASTYEPIDTEKSIAAIEDALEELDALRVNERMTKEVWEIRKELLDDQLLRPLRRHRSNQLNSYAVAPIE